MAITAFTKTCAKHAGGCAALRLFNIASATVTITDNLATALTLSEGTCALIGTDIDGLKRDDNGTGTKDGRYSSEQIIEYKISKANEALIAHVEEIADASPCGLGALVLDNNGQWWLAGVSKNSVQANRGLYLATDAFTSGNETDEDGSDTEVMTLSGKFPNKMIPVDPTKVVSDSGIAVA